MSRKALLSATLIIAILFACLHLVAITFSLYWTVHWYDILMHFFGGFTLGVFAIFLSQYQSRSWRSFLLIFAVVMSLALVWEVFEYVYGIAVVAGENYIPDTLQDILMDSLGVGVSYFIFLRSR